MDFVSVMRGHHQYNGIFNRDFSVRRKKHTHNSQLCGFPWKRRCRQRMKAWFGRKRCQKFIIPHSKKCQSPIGSKYFIFYFNFELPSSSAKILNWIPNMFIYLTPLMMKNVSIRGYLFCCILTVHIGIRAVGTEWGACKYAT